MDEYIFNNGPAGKKFVVLARFTTHLEKWFFETEDQAWEERDQLRAAGAVAVRVLVATTEATTPAPRLADTPLPEIREEESGPAAG